MKFFKFILLVFVGVTTKTMASESTQLTINSKISNQQVEVELYLPQSYSEQTEKHYPVFITTAGKSRKAVAVEQIRWLSHVGFAPIPEVILIVLPEIKLEQLTNKFDSASGAVDKTRAEILVTEVLPAIDKSYRTTGYRLVEGFSTRGNFPLYLLRHYSADFNAFFAFSPSLELDKSKLVESFSNDWSLSPKRNHFVYLSLGTFKENRPLYQSLTQSLLTKQKSDGFEFVHADLSKENYLSGPNIGLIEASQSLFSDLRPDYEQFHETGIKGVAAHFDTLSEKYMEPVEWLGKLVSLSFSYANSGKFNQAVDTMKFLVAKNESNVLYRIRLAQIQIRAERNKEALETLSEAKELAKASNNVEALDFIEQIKPDVTR